MEPQKLALIALIVVGAVCLGALLAIKIFVMSAFAVAKQR